MPLTSSCCSLEEPCIPPGCFGVDVGPATAAAYRAALGGVATLLWNGPMGRCGAAADGRVHAAGGARVRGWVWRRAGVHEELPALSHSERCAAAMHSACADDPDPPCWLPPCPSAPRYEVPAFSAGTTAMVETVTAATQRGAATCIGGGDSLAAFAQAGPAARVSFASTGGGASLELLEGAPMPGLRALLPAST